MYVQVEMCSAMKRLKHDANIISSLTMLLLNIMAMIFTHNKVDAGECLRQDFGEDSFVCICNATYCDTVDSWEKPDHAVVLSYTTDNKMCRFHKQELKFNDEPPNSTTNSTDIHVSIHFDTSNIKQTIVGFGGSFTDATGINILSLTPDLQEELKKAYFSEKGLEYNLFRVPIGGTDFSTRGYSYDDDSADDFELRNFTLQKEDHEYKIPFIKDAQKMSKRPVKLVASSWSPPAWMKTSNSLYGGGTLRGEIGGPYYDLLAHYYIKFLEEYKKHGIEFYGLTTQNEPITGLVPFYPFNCLGLTRKMLLTFVKKNLGPRLRESEFNSTKLLIYDHDRLLLWPYADAVISDCEAEPYVDGIALHWYSDHIVTPKILDIVHNKYPKKAMLMTETCVISPFGRFGQLLPLGSWYEADQYAYYIIQNLQHWITGWIDWNMALDLQGGPNWVENFVAAPIVVNSKKNEFYKQPVYYIMGHFSKFIPPGSEVVETSQSNDNHGISSVGFSTPNSTFVLVVLNRNSDLANLHITDTNIGTFHATIPSKAIITFIWSKK